METHFRSQQELNQVNAENLQAEADMRSKVKMANELLEVVTKYGIVNQHTANKVKEIRKTKLMDDDVMLQQLIIELAKKGYFTV